MSREQRRLAAIVAADVVGYSRLMGRDESGTFSRLRDHRKERLEPSLARYGGRLVKLAGDGAIVEFASAVDALGAAIEFQQAIADANAGQPAEEAVVFRVGLHVGDLIVEGDDLYGDGVNVAARLEGEAPAGGILISRSAHDSVLGLVKATFEDAGRLALKNIDRPIRAFSVTWRPEDWRNTGAPAPATVTVPLALPLPDKPSIAVLPFENFGGDPEQEYFADGMVDDVLTALSRFKQLFVIARNSSFTYKGKNVDIKQVGRELGVRYVLEGSVRKAAGRARIVCQLIDATTGAHLWADRFEGDLSDIFALQDEVVVNVVSAIQPTLLRSGIELASRRRPENLTAYDLYLRAAPHFFSMTRDGMAEALRLLAQSLALDPFNGFAASMAGSGHILNIGQGWAEDPKLEMAKGTQLLQRALSIDENDADALCVVGRVRAYLFGDFDATIEMVDRAVSLNPNSALAWEQRGWTYEYAGRAEEAVRSFELAIRLSPLDPLLFSTLTGMSVAFISLGRFEEAVDAARRSLRRNENFPSAYRSLAAALAHLGHEEEARKTAARLLELDPRFRISDWVARGANWRADVYVDGLRKAGLPD